MEEFGYSSPHSRTSRFIPDERAPDTHWKEVRVGPKTSLGKMTKMKVSEDLSLVGYGDV